jgi:predicted helicase
LEARLRALLRRSQILPQSVQQLGNLRLDRAGQRAWCNDTPLDLSARELTVLEILMGNIDRVVTKEQIVAELSQYGFEKEQKELEPFYNSVRLRAEGIDNAQAKQKIIITLYDKFFSTSFKSTTERLGIVFTPVEVVDFIVKSVDVVLRKHFGKTIASENVHILDPFTGTGTFITRTLHYLKSLMDKGEMSYADLVRKYTQELHANEIVLLSYYIAAINIEAVFYDINGEEDYLPFEGIVLTDTFESTESEDTLDDSFFGTNDKRLKRQQEKPITAIIGNPPYSIGQGSQNDNNKNKITKYIDVINKTFDELYSN